MRASRSRRAGARSRGFSLIEVMISLLLFSLIIAGAFASMMVMSRTQSASSRLEVAQEGVRAAMQLITRDVEMAGAGAKSGIIYLSTGATTQVNAVSVIDAYATNGSDRLDLYLVDPSAHATLTATYSGGASLTVDDNSSFAAGDTVQLSDLSTAVQLTVTGTSSSDTLVVTSPTNSLPQSFSPGCYVFKARNVSYYVDPDGEGTGNPMLMMDPDGSLGPEAAQPVAEGLEDLQVALGYDEDGNGQIASAGAAAGDDEWIYDVSGETAPASMSALRVARITLVARPLLPWGGGNVNTRPAAEDHAASTTGDGYPRRVLHSEVSIRNFNL